MFESLTQRLSGTIERLRGRGRLTEENIREATREVRIALLEADVALPVVQALIERIKVRAVGQEVLRSLTPGPGADQGRARRADRGDGLAGERPQPQRARAGGDPDGRPAGRGQDHDRRQARQAPEGAAQEEGDGGVSADVYRPAAIEQLKTLAQQVDVLFFPSDASQKPVAIVRAAIDDARKSFADVLIVDTAGRTSIDDAMMAEIKALHAAVVAGRNPVRGRFDDRPGRRRSPPRPSARRCR